MIRPHLRSRSIAALLLATLSLAAPLAAQRPIPGLDAAGMDLTIRPGDDFYHYANGNWERNTAIPADRSSFGSFNIAALAAQRQLTELVSREAAAGAPAGSELRKIGDFYSSWDDTVAIKARGLAPLQPLLARIDALQDRAELARFLGATLRADVDVINDGELDTDNLLAQVRSAYREHVANLLNLAGVPGAAAKAATVPALETKIARAQASREDTWDAVKGNNHWARADFPGRAPGLDGEGFFQAAALDVDTLVAWQPGAIAGLSALVASEPLAAWKALLTYHAIEHRAAVLRRPSTASRSAFSAVP